MSSVATTWAIVTGEYPPQSGGVSDHARQLAHALASAGDEVHVLAPAPDRGMLPPSEPPGVAVHRLEGGFGARGLRRLAAEMAAIGPRRILVEWVPHAFGWKGMNVPLALWLSRLESLEVLFHEVHAPYGQGSKRDIVASITRFMSGRLARSARRIYVTIPAWADILRGLGAATDPIWLPVPSNMPLAVDPDEVRALRERLGPAPLVGHFGTFGEPVVALLEPALRALRAGSRLLLLGRGGDAFARERGFDAVRVLATGALDPHDVARHLAACDVVFQPYPDGASARRTSLMTGLALGLPIVTNEGTLSEPLWRESGAVALSEPAPARFAERIDGLLADPDERARLGAAARELYASRFAIEHVVRLLRGAA